MNCINKSTVCPEDCNYEKCHSYQKMKVDIKFDRTKEMLYNSHTIPIHRVIVTECTLLFPGYKYSRKIFKGPNCKDDPYKAKRICFEKAVSVIKDKSLRGEFWKKFLEEHPEPKIKVFPEVQSQLIVEDKKEMPVYDPDSDPRYYFEMEKNRVLTDYSDKPEITKQQIDYYAREHFQKVYEEQGPFINLVPYKSIFNRVFQIVEHYEKLLFPEKDLMVKEILDFEFHKLMAESKEGYCLFLTQYLKSSHLVIIKYVYSNTEEFKDYNKFLIEFLELINFEQIRI
jgi:hypothetical protein